MLVRARSDCHNYYTMPVQILDTTFNPKNGILKNNDRSVNSDIMNHHRQVRSILKIGIMNHHRQLRHGDS